MKKVWKIYFKLLIIILLIGFVINLTSCATSKKTNSCDCPSYTMKIPYEDTIVFDKVHDHFYFDGHPYCLFIESFTIIETDTIYLELNYDIN